VRTLLFIFIFITVINVPAVTFIAIWFFMQVVNSLSVRASNVAWYAHVGGFIFGISTILLFQKRESRRRRKNTRYRIY
jgi:membrane associated rhomboid family serine protease